MNDMIKIWAKDLADEMNVSVAFRYRWRGGPISLRVAAATAFRLFSDGELIGYGPRRAAHGISHFNDYALNAPSGTLVVEVASYRCNNYYLPDEPPFFACEVSQFGKVVAESTDFRAYRLIDRIQKVQRYSIQRTFVESYDMECDRTALYLGERVRYPELRCERVEGNRLSDCDLPYPEWRTIPITHALECGNIEPEKNPFHYADRAITQISPTQKGFPKEELDSFISEEVGAISFHKTGTDAPDTLSDSYVLYDMGMNDTGFIRLDAESLTDCDLYLIFDEIIWEEARQNPAISYWFDRAELPLCFYRIACCNIVKYHLKAGNYQNLLSFEPYTFRYIKIVVKGRAKSKLSFVPYVNSEVTLEFKTADPMLDKIFFAAASTFRQNAVDILTDCPSRERAGWLCDSYFSGRAERLLTGANRVERNMLQAFADAPQLPELPEGILPMCYPADHRDGTYIPNWSMFFVLELEEYFVRTGDMALIAACREKVEKLVSFFENKYVNRFGLLENLDSWVFVEWSKAAEFTKGINYPSNMLYARMLEGASRLYGDARLSERAEEVRAAIRKYSYNGMFFEDNAIVENGEIVKTGNCTETCQYYAFYFGTANRESYGALYERIFSEFGFRRDDTITYPNIYRSNAFIGNFLRLDYLRREGRVVQTLEECRDYFGYMAERTGTLWEHAGSEASCNHCFASYAAQFLVECVTGFVSWDENKKTIYRRKPSIDISYRCRIPIGKHFLVLEQERTVLPEGYRMVEV